MTYEEYMYSQPMRDGLEMRLSFDYDDDDNDTEEESEEQK